MKSVNNRAIVRAFGALVMGAVAFASGTQLATAAETKTVQRTVTVYMLSDAPKLAEQVTAICADKSVKLSDKARRACDDKAFPPLTKSLMFRSSGIGGEFNTLIRQRS